MSGAQEQRREESMPDAKEQFLADLAPYQARLQELKLRLEQNEAESTQLKSKIAEAELKIQEVTEGSLYWKLMMKE